MWPPLSDRNRDDCVYMSNGYIFNACKLYIQDKKRVENKNNIEKENNNGNKNINT